MTTSPKYTKKLNLNQKTSINLEAKKIVEPIKLDDYIQCIARTPAFITFKDRKPNLRENPSYRLINPAKNELGKVSKVIIKKINKRTDFRNLF